MGGTHRNGSIRKKIKAKVQFPKIVVDQDNDFASIKLAAGVEAKSYAKEGFVFCEDRQGRIIEIQILNLSELKNTQKPNAA